MTPSWITYLLYFLLSLAFIVIFLLIFFSVYLHYVRSKYRHIPGPELSSFFLGNIPDIREQKLKGKNPHEIFLSWSFQFGPLFRLHLLHKTMIVVSSRDIIKEILIKKEYPKSSMVYGMLFNVCGQRFLGKGLVTNTNSEEWLRKHLTVRPAFNKKSLKIFMRHLNMCCDNWINKLTLNADGTTPIDIMESLNHLTLNIIVNFTCGSDIFQLEGHKIFKAFEIILHGMDQQYRDPLLPYRISKWKFRRSVREAAVYIRKMGRNVIEKRMRENKTVGNNLLDLLVPSLNDSNCSVEDILDDFVTIFIAGHETTANALGFIFYELTRHPNVLSKLRAEIEENIRDQSQLQLETLSTMTYMTQVIKETLRLYPIVSATAREPIQDSYLHGYMIPKGTFLAVPFGVLHRRPEYFSNPMDFNPDRFHPSNPRPFYAFSPFSQGQRSCLGKQFAMMIMKSALCKFLNKFDFHMDPKYEFCIEEISTYKPKSGCPLILSVKDF